MAKTEKKTSSIAVIRDPKEVKVASLMKMLKTTYDEKQEQLKAETKLRLEKHRREVEAQEGMKAKKIREKKKNVMRYRSKAEAKKKSK